MEIVDCVAYTLFIGLVLACFVYSQCHVPSAAQQSCSVALTIFVASVKTPVLHLSAVLIVTRTSDRLYDFGTVLTRLWHQSDVTTSFL